MSAQLRAGGFGPALKALRASAGMTLDEVSEAAGVSVSYLSRVEAGEVVPERSWTQCVATALSAALRGDVA